MRFASQTLLACCSALLAASGAVASTDWENDSGWCNKPDAAMGEAFDVDETLQAKFAKSICDDWADFWLGPKADVDNAEITSFSGVYFGDENEVNPYYYYAGWKPGCTLPDTVHQWQSVQYPYSKTGTEEWGNPTCWEQFRNAFGNCVNNGGRGGYYTIGCVVYGFEPCDSNKHSCFSTSNWGDMEKMD